MNHIFGLVFFKKREKAFKAGVAGILAIVDPICRGVCYQNITAPFSLQLPPEPANPFDHLLFGILVRWSAVNGMVVIFDGSSQAHNTQPLEDHKLILNAVAAFRRLLFVMMVMIAVNIEERSFDHGNEKGEVFAFQVAAGYDKINPLEAFSLKVIPE
jgi:hypothetical protein